MTEPDPITDDELDQIERRAAAASPAPWESFVEGRDHTSGDDFIRISGPDDTQLDMYIQHYLGAAPVAVPPADLDFVASARQDVPRLIQEIRRLRAAQGRK